MGRDRWKPNRISSSGRGRPDRFKLDRLRWSVFGGRCCTAVNCNPKCNPWPSPGRKTSPAPAKISQAPGVASGNRRAGE